MAPLDPPVEFLSLCSDRSLCDFELAARNRAANLRKELIALADELSRAEAEALFAACLRLHRRAFASQRGMEFLQESFDFVGVALVEAPAVRRLEGHGHGHAEQPGELPVG